MWGERRKKEGELKNKARGRKPTEKSRRTNDLSIGSVNSEVVNSTLLSIYSAELSFSN